MLVSLFMVSTFLTLLTFSMYVLTCAFYKFLRPVYPAKLADRDLPFVSICVPARNEEKKIARCLDSLISQNYPSFEIIVVDDRSTDATAEIIESFVAKDARVKLVRGKDTPSGWIGKCNALAHAVGYASGDWFAFTDADTFHQPNSIRDAVCHGLTNKADLVSFMPMQELGSFPERLVMPLLLGSFLLGDPFHSVNDPAAQRAYAYGQYIITRRSSYLAVGGHQSVRDEILEDHALSRVFKEKGYRILVGDGKSLYSVRMYTDLESMWQGWTKNLYSLIESRIGNLFLVLFLINSTILYPFVQVPVLIQLFVGGESPATLQILAIPVLLQLLVVYLWYRKTSEHHAGIGPKQFFLLPFGALAVSVLYLHASFLVLSGGQVNWKGRRYTVNTFKTIQPRSKQSLDPALDTVLGQDRADL
jgi:chlorobactene glucosyltransferase